MCIIVDADRIALQTDFKDRKILANPRGRIYSGAKNRQLLNSTICRQ